ncbi:MAG: hypothetical protein R3D57_19120 [Hyphomicrobiaceae bacterium]
MSVLSKQSASVVNARICAFGGQSPTLDAILAALIMGPPVNGQVHCKVVETHDPALYMFHILADWQRSQVAVAVLGTEP